MLEMIRQPFIRPPFGGLSELMGLATPRCTPCVAPLRTPFAWGHWRTPAFGRLKLRRAPDPRGQCLETTNPRPFHWETTNPQPFKQTAAHPIGNRPIPDNPIKPSATPGKIWSQGSRTKKGPAVSMRAARPSIIQGQRNRRYIRSRLNLTYAGTGWAPPVLSVPARVQTKPSTTSPKTTPTARPIPLSVARMPTPAIVRKSSSPMIRVSSTGR